MQSFTAPKSVTGDLPTEDGEDVSPLALFIMVSIMNLTSHALLQLQVLSVQTATFSVWCSALLSKQVYEASF